MDSATRTLVKYDAMCRAIDDAQEIPEIKEIRDKAVALEMYFRIAKNPAPERAACNIRIRAERKAGILLRAREKAKGTLKRGKDLPRSDGTTTGPETLGDLGISKDQSANWQKMSEIDEEAFERLLIGNVKPTTKSIVREAEKKNPKKKKPKPKKVEPIDEHALWLWGRLLDMEREKRFERDPAELLVSEDDRADAI